MCVVVIPRIASSGAAKGLAWWDANGWVLVRCPNGHVHTLMHPGPHRKLSHDVAADGTIAPSLVCPGTGKNDCDWHVFARLEGWTG